MAGENLVRPKGLKAKIANFWYHYKVHSIVSILVAITLSVSIVQCSTATKYDYTIVVATHSMTLSTPQIEGIKKELNQYGKDLNGDGEVNLQLVDCTVNGRFDYTQNSDGKQQKLQMMLMSNTDAMLFLVDEKALAWIDELNRQTRFIADTGLPNNDGRGFLIGDTHIIENPKKSANYETNLRWPSDLMICRRKVEGTTFEGDPQAVKNAKDADEFIQRIVKKNTK